MTDLQQRMENKSAKELVEILEFYQEDYTTEALQIAFTILEQRNLSANELTEIRSQIKLEFEEIESKTQKQKELSNSIVKKFLQDKVFYSILIGGVLYFLIGIFNRLSFWSFDHSDFFYYSSLLLEIVILIVLIITYHRKIKLGWYLLNGVLCHSLLIRLLSPIQVIMYPEYNQNGIFLDLLTPFLSIEFYFVLFLVLGINSNKLRTIFAIKNVYFAFFSLIAPAIIELISFGLMWIS